MAKEIKLAVIYGKKKEIYKEYSEESCIEVSIETV